MLTLFSEINSNSLVNKVINILDTKGIKLDASNNIAGCLEVFNVEFPYIYRTN